MGLTTNEKKDIDGIANDSLDKFKKISDAARRRLNDEPGHASGAMAAVNTFTHTGAIDNLENIRKANRASYEQLVREPAIARVAIEKKNGEKVVYFICRTTSLPRSSGVENFASYRSPIGRLASLPVCETMPMQDGQIVEVVERALLHPFTKDGEWDSKNSIVETVDCEPFTITSFLEFLGRAGARAITLFDELLEEERSREIVRAGISRAVITKMGLRDQPVLDKYQDEIFRLPLNRRLLILGAPGTGKTTTLIRRLGQKLDVEILEENEDEKRIVERIESSGGAPHTSSWLMFTPTELLKQYLKEAFAREEVAASDQRIRTWNDFRRELARNTFGILRTASGSGSMILKDNAETITAKAIDEPIAWFTEFDTWQRRRFLEDLQKSALALQQSDAADVQAAGQRLNEILGKAQVTELASVFTALAAEIPSIESIVSKHKSDTDAKIRASLNLQINKDRSFLDSLAAFIAELQQAQPDELEDDEEQEAEDEESTVPHRSGRLAATTAYERAVRSHARAYAGKRTLSRNSRSGKIIEWLGDRMLDEASQLSVGTSLLVLRNARQFVSPVRRFLTGVPRRYRAYRREAQQRELWYSRVPFSATEAHPLELDVMLLSILRGGDALISTPIIGRSLTEPVWTVLKPFSDLRRNQILVDEATDFSPIQLACMATLAHPAIRSFFACGDFNQRLTVWGSRSITDMKWVFPDMEVMSVSVTYRQTRQLNELARGLIRAVGATEQDTTLPTSADNEGVSPVLLESTSETSDIAQWLAIRIREIERHIGQLPSTAVFVNGEADVSPLAEALNDILTGDNIRAVACPLGQVMGQDNDVRVFDIQHIKGLEFEAVFFVSIDELATLHPRLFDKYLYVGTTRAATYLGFTCRGKLPPSISSLRPLFIDNWS